MTNRTRLWVRHKRRSRPLVSRKRAMSMRRLRKLSVKNQASGVMHSGDRPVVCEQAQPGELVVPSRAGKGCARIDRNAAIARPDRRRVPLVFLHNPRWRSNKDQSLAPNQSRYQRVSIISQSRIAIKIQI